MAKKCKKPKKTKSFKPKKKPKVKYRRRSNWLLGFSDLTDEVKVYVRR